MAPRHEWIVATATEHRHARRREYNSLGDGLWLATEFAVRAYPYEPGALTADQAEGLGLLLEVDPDSPETRERLDRAGIVSVARLTLAHDADQHPPTRIVSIEVRRLDRSAVATDDLRLPLALLTREAVKASRLHGPAMPPGEALPDVLRPELRWGRDLPDGRVVREPVREPFDPQGRRVVDARHLAEVAACYVEALNAGEPATGSPKRPGLVARRFHLSPVAARKRIVQARLAGLLTTTTEGRKGGELTPLAEQILENPNPEQEV